MDESPPGNSLRVATNSFFRIPSDSWCHCLLHVDARPTHGKTRGQVGGGGVAPESVVVHPEFDSSTVDDSRSDFCILYHCSMDS